MADDGRRRPNFTQREIEVLLELERENPMLRAKHRDAGTNQRMKKLLETIAASVSAVGVAKRTPEECRKKLISLCSDTKAKAATSFKEQRKTGGGVCTAGSMTVLDQAILSFLPDVAYKGISSGFDSGDVSTLPKSQSAGDASLCVSEKRSGSTSADRLVNCSPIYVHNENKNDAANAKAVKMDAKTSECNSRKRRAASDEDLSKAMRLQSEMVELQRETLSELKEMRLDLQGLISVLSKMQDA